MKQFTLSVLAIVIITAIVGLYLSFSATQITGESHIPLSDFGAPNIAVWAEDTTGNTIPAKNKAEAGFRDEAGEIMPDLTLGTENLTINIKNPIDAAGQPTKKLIVYKTAYISDTKTIPGALSWKPVPLTGKTYEITYRGKTITIPNLLEAGTTGISININASEILFTEGKDNFLALVICNEITPGIEYDCNGPVKNKGSWVLHEIEAFTIPRTPTLIEIAEFGVPATQILVGFEGPSDGTSTAVGSSYVILQAFELSINSTIQGIELFLEKKVIEELPPVTLELYTDLNNEPNQAVATSTLNYTQIPEGQNWVAFNFLQAIALVSGKYWISIKFNAELTINVTAPLSWKGVSSNYFGEENDSLILNINTNQLTSYAVVVTEPKNGTLTNDFLFRVQGAKDPKSPQCTDTDYGKNYYVKGNTTGLVSGQLTTRTDICINQTVEENYCSTAKGNIGVKYHDCPYGCQDGACLPPPPTPTEVCGNGILEGTETCDDGNTINGDGCSSMCTVETGYTCTGTPSVCSQLVTKFKAGASFTLPLNSDSVFNGNLADDRAGLGMTIGDFNNDGITDVVIGVFLGDSAGFTNNGQAHIIFGPLKKGKNYTYLDANATLHGLSGDFAGVEIDAGDFNNDGITDIIIGAYGIDAGNIIDAGRAYIVFGPFVQGQNTYLNDSADVIFAGGAETKYTGLAVGAGDFNNDGIDDAVVSSRSAKVTDLNNGRVHIVFGPFTSGQKIIFENITADVVFDGDAANQYLGSSVSSSDFNKDGVDDIIIGNNYASNSAGTVDYVGQAYVFFGPFAKGSNTFVNTTTGGDVTFEGTSQSDFAGMSVAGGDLNNDGADDVVIGAHGVTVGGLSYAGTAYALFGPFTKGQRFNLNTNAHMKFLGSKAYDGVGSGAAIGDIDNDGLTDVIIGVMTASPDNILRAGQAHIILGSQS